MQTRHLPLLALLALTAPLVSTQLACATAESARAPAEKLYLSMEVRSGGRLVGKPKLLGESGKTLKVERRAPGSDVADYKMVLLPTPEGDHYAVQLDVQVPDAGQNLHSQLAILHGEVKTVQLGHKPGDLDVELMIMRVDSPEFRALMGMADPDKAPNSI